MATGGGVITVSALVSEIRIESVEALMLMIVSSVRDGALNSATVLFILICSPLLMPELANIFIAYGG